MYSKPIELKIFTSQSFDEKIVRVVQSQIIN